MPYRATDTFDRNNIKAGFGQLVAENRSGPAKSDDQHLL
jgi:hypothetical protein